MHRILTFMACMAIILFGSVLQAQAQFSIRAASAEPVAGWDKIDFDNRSVWVSPSASLTAADVASAQQGRDQEGRTAVSVVFTDPGEKKMRDLTKTQLDKLIAIVLDGKVIFAPRVRGEIGKEGMITGNGPNGLGADLVQRLLASLNQK